MKLILGIGNIGEKYENTYHNVGFMVVDKLAKYLKVNFENSECKALIAVKEVKGDKIVILKPTTYVNLSGEALVLVMKKFKIKEQDVIVAVDDIDMPAGKVRYRINGSSGTHNGLRNIVANLQSENFKRIKIGIGRDENMRLDQFVLSNISEENKEIINNSIERAVQHLLNIIENKANENLNVTI